MTLKKSYETIINVEADVDQRRKSSKKYTKASDETSTVFEFLLMAAVLIMMGVIILRPKEVFGAIGPWVKFD